MASPQLENGFTRIANELLRAVYRSGIPGIQMCILLAVIRLTYGFNMKQRELSVTYLAKEIKRPYQRVAEALNQLIKNNFIKVIRDYSIKQEGRILSVNKNYESWIQKSSRKEVENSHELGESNSTPKRENIKKDKKETLKKDAAGDKSSSEEQSHKIKQRINKYALCNLPEGTECIFYKGAFFYVTHELICEIKEKLTLDISDEDLRAEFYRMECWLDSENKVIKDFKRFFVNWLAKTKTSFNRHSDRFSGSSQDYECI